MFNGIVQIAANVWGKLFPERQIYLRSNGRVRYATMSPGLQFIFSALFLSAFIWTSFASINIAMHQGALSARDARISALQTNYERLSLELAEVQQRFVSSTAQNQKIQDFAEAPSTETGASALLTDATAALVVPMDGSGIPGVLPRPRPQGGRARLDSSQNEIMPRERPRRPAFRLPESLTAAGGKNYAEDYSFGSGLSIGRLSDSKRSQNDVIGYLAADANTAAVALEKLINLTGLDADTMLRRRDAVTAANGPAEGGPLLTVPPSMTGKLLRHNHPGQLAMLSTRKGRVEMLREALFSLPLAEPVGKYYVSSGYGYRRDPFTHARAFHSGVDLVAPHGDPVSASAPGTVIFAGRNGPYGNMVEIDHGHGVKSRYGHLSKINVTRGQKIGLHDLIGRVGNTGRSGTAHLHFEVWFDGKARDPRNFLKAGENVFHRQG
ncbi:MAG: M23 family metallopeptidase [Alphaproteobacteria bacterium]